MIITKNYRFSGVEFSIRMAEEIMYTDERYLAPFRVDTVTDPHIFNFTSRESLVAPTGNCVAEKPGFRVYKYGERFVRYIGSVSESREGAYMRAQYNGKIHDIQIKRSRLSGRVGTHTVLSALAAEHFIARNDGVVFHCSYIDCGGMAILFTAPSETGKSTQADLWHKYRNADIINGDRAVIRLVDGRLYADGIPFAGSSSHCLNRTLPLGAIVYLDQSPVTSIRRIKGYRAFAKIWEGVSVNTWDKEDMEKVSALIKKTAETVPIFYMPCTPDESAITALERAMEGET